MEDKKCRICGFADMKNVNIFSANNCKALLAKILAVYPIVLYENDPLPKNICKKCIYNVTFMYNDVQRVLKTQTKWISNVRTVQPNNSYIRVLDMIESSNKATRASIKSSLGEDICPQSVNRLLVLTRPESSRVSKDSTAASSKSSSCPSKTLSSTIPTKSTVRPLQPKVADVKKSPKLAETSVAVPKSNDKITSIKSILELNGCTLLKLGAKQAIKDSSQPQRVEKDTQLVAKKSKLTIKDKETSDDEMDGTTTQLNATLPPLTVKCRYCPSQFNSLEALAMHQTIHLRISLPRIFMRKYLTKGLRRGRLIIVENRQCIRCLNCWRVFADNKSILGHWAQSECDFYCQICGKEFPHSARMLREHVPAAHNISYRMLKLQRDLAYNAPLLEQASLASPTDNEVDKAACEQKPALCEKDEAPSTSSAVVKREEKEPTKSKIYTSPPTSLLKKADLILNEDGSVTCHICFKVFNNFKARNSHMRKHKYCADGPGRTAYMADDPYISANKDSASSSSGATILTQIAKDASSPLPSTQLVALNSTPATVSYSSSSSTRSTVVRGVRTKFVSLRKDLTPAARIKVKSMYDLQTVANSKLTSADVATPTATRLQADHVPYVIKEEPLDIDDGVGACESTTPPLLSKTAPAADRSLQCPTCGEEKLDLVMHMHHCRPTVRHTCESCSKTFEIKTDYDVHMMYAHGQLCVN